MHIDHSKLVELLADTLGQDTEKVEKQLAELVTEIQEAIAEGDAYEVDGLGVFSGFGNNIIFMPHDDLATEINYKYAGMEALELDEGPSEEEPKEEGEDSANTEPFEEEIPVPEEDPFSGLLDDIEGEDEVDDDEDLSPAFELDKPEDETGADDDEDDFEDPFDIAGKDFEDEDGDEEEIVNDSSEEDEEEEYKPGPDKWGIDTYKDDSAEKTFSGLLGDKDSEDEGFEDQPLAPDDEFSSIFEEEEDESDDDNELAAALNKQLSDEDEDENDSEDEDLNSLFEEEDQDEEIEPEPELPKESFTLDTDREREGDEKENDPEDPFEALAGEEEEEDDIPESLSQEAEDDTAEDEVVPVIKNISTEGSTKKKADKKKSEEKSPPKESKPKVQDSQKKAPPVMIWVVLLIVVIAGSVYGLGYFGVMNIPGVTPISPEVASTQPPAQPEQTSPTQQQEPEPQEQETTPDPQPEEQPAEPEVSQTESVPAGQNTYGLTGTPVGAANNGYTIVVFSLRSESGAKAKQDELTQQGYRALLATIPSQQYGQLWRVSLGQFETQRSAAVAAEDLEAPYSENYFITEIQ